MALPLRLSWGLAQDRWASSLNPIIQFPPNQGTLLKNVSLDVGVNQVNHKLGRNQQGWIVTDIDAAAQIYRSQPFNSTILTLTSDVACTINLWVY